MCEWSRIPEDDRPKKYQSQKTKIKMKTANRTHSETPQIIAVIFAATAIVLFALYLCFIR